MTLLGKILLFVNLVVSLLIAAWGIALYTGRINWTDKSAPEAGQTELSKLVERVNQLAKPVNQLKPVVEAAGVNNRDAAVQLQTKQRERVYNVSWYKYAADRLQSGANEQQPADAPVLQGGLPIPQTPTRENPAPLQVEPAKDRAGEPLRSYAAYVNDLLAVQTQIKTEMDKLTEQNKKYLDLSQKIVGVINGGGKVITPGLRQLLQDEEDKLSKVLAQQEVLRPLLVNSYFDIQPLAKRRDELEKRVKELGRKAGAETARTAGIGIDK